MSRSGRKTLRVIDSMALPFITNINIAQRTPQPYLIDGFNVMTGERAVIERRPGFAPFTGFVFPGSGEVRRFFTWHRWNGSYFVMASVITPAGDSQVYKHEVNVDAGFVFIHGNVSTEPFDYVVANNFIFFGNGTPGAADTGMKKYDGTTVTNWGIQPQPTTGPNVVDAGAGNVPGNIGHRWVYTYGVSTTGYVSDVSLVSPTLANTPSRQWTISGPRSNDPQCDLIHIYRTEDGGSVFFELSNSPIPNPAAATWSIVDNDFDGTNLSTPHLQPVQAPLRGVNQPPPPLFGFRYFAGRIWGFMNDRVHFSGLEEVSNGVPEESFGTILTNTQAFGEQVNAVEVLSDPTGAIGVLTVGCGSNLFYISGDSLATFRVGTLSRNRGILARAAVSSGEGYIVWLDSSNTIQYLELGQRPVDISLPIRRTVIAVDHTTASITVYEDGVHHWIILCLPNAENLNVYDLDRRQWMPRWIVEDIHVIASGEISAGQNRLFLGRGNQAFVMTPLIYLDDGAPYTSVITLGNLSLLAETNPEALASIEYIGIETDSHLFSSILYLTDDDPLISVNFVLIPASNIVPPAYRNHDGTDLIERWAYVRTDSGCRRVCIQIQWPAVNSNFNLYTLTVAGERLGIS